LWDRNQNTGNPIGMDAEIEVAEQTIYHDSRHPSHIILPIIPVEEHP
jgi:predicted acyl esterase